MQGPVLFSNHHAQGSHPAPPPQHSVQQGSFCLATQEMSSCCKAPKVSPGAGGRTCWKSSSALCPETAVEALCPLGETAVLLLWGALGQKSRWCALCWPSLSRQSSPPLQVCGAWALSAGYPGNSCNVEGTGRSAEGLKVLWATQPVLHIGKGLSDRAWDTKKSFPSPFLWVKN